MKRGRLTLTNKLGLHARAASELVSLARQFSADISIAHGNRTVDGKSIMSLLMLAAACGAELELRIDGEDESDAFEAISRLVQGRFGEDE